MKKADDSMHFNEIPKLQISFKFCEQFLCWVPCLQTGDTNEAI